MSITLQLDESKLDEIIPVLDKYQDQIEAAAPIFNIEGRRLEEVARTLAHYQASYDQSLHDIKAVEEWINVIKEKKVGKLWKKYTEGYSRQLTAKDIQAYIGADQEIVDINQIQIEVVRIKGHLAAIVESIKQLGWMVGHMTKLRVAELQDAVL